MLSLFMHFSLLDSALLSLWIWWLFFPRLSTGVQLQRGTSKRNYHFICTYNSTLFEWRKLCCYVKHLLVWSFSKCNLQHKMSQPCNNWKHAFVLQSDWSLFYSINQWLSKYSKTVRCWNSIFLFFSTNVALNLSLFVK